MSTYLVVLRLVDDRSGAAEWPTRQIGRPTNERLARYVREFELSTLPNGENSHLGRSLVQGGSVVRRGGQCVAAYNRPTAGLGGRWDYPPVTLSGYKPNLDMGPRPARGNRQRGRAVLENGDIDQLRELAIGWDTYALLARAILAIMENLGMLR